MIEHEVRTHKSAEALPRDEQLAWKLAAVATDPVPVEAEVAEMVVNRLIDDAGVAAAALRRRPVANARAQALRHALPGGGDAAVRAIGAVRPGGATVFGCPSGTHVQPEWAAWANCVAVRELDFHDTFLAAEYSHPGDNIPPLLAVAQHTGCNGHDLVRAIATSYEVQVDLSRGISLHAHRIDHVAHLGPSVAAGTGTLLGLPTEVVYQAIGQALHTTTATRQSRKGAISTWKAYAPAFAGKVAIEAVDRAMRGETSPAPIYEGEDGVIAWLLDGPDAVYVVPLPAPGEPKRAILRTYTKEYSAEYQAQAFIDLAKRLREDGRLRDLADVSSVRIYTSHHTHNVIGTGSGDPEKFDPDASRETLDHSLPYIFAVALQDGTWHHELSYSPERAHRPSTVALWHKISTEEGPVWTKRYLSGEAFGGRAVVQLADGSTVEAEIVVADAHPLGARPFGRAEYIEKFRRLAHGTVPEAEQDRFLSLAERLLELGPGQVRLLSLIAPWAGNRHPQGGPVLMFHTQTPASERRQELRKGLSSGRLLRFPGAFNPLSALLIERLGFEGVYVSGAALSASLALPDIGLTTLSEVASRSHEISRITALPTLVDADTGFGEPLNTARTVNVLEDLGLSGCHIEDQVNPKRCGHLDGKEIVTAAEMRRRIRAAVGARRDPGFAICARTDARAVEGLSGAIERAKSYLDEGADIVFPDALEGASELDKFKQAVDAPLLANMTEFGKTELLDITTLASIGVNIVIYPVTLLRLAMGAAERGLRALASEGTQKGLLEQMQTRAELYELLGYDDYTAFDTSLGEI